MVNLFGIVYWACERRGKEEEFGTRRGRNKNLVKMEIPEKITLELKFTLAFMVSRHPHKHEQSSPLQ